MLKTLYMKIGDRYLDDCEILLYTTLIQPEQLLHLINSLNTKIQFTMETSTTGIPFLDILVKRDETGIWMDLYRKPTDTQRCLDFNPSHPSHCKTNIPFTMARRICTIVENENIKKKHLNELRKNLTKYHYPEKIIENGIKKATTILQSDLRKPKTITNDKNLAFVSTFNPNNPNIFPLIQNAVRTLSVNNVNGFKDIKLVHGKRQAPNLKNILTKATFGNNTTVGVFKCNDKRCKCCENHILNDNYTFKNTNKNFKIKSKMTCDSSNLVYVVICPTCREEYIGETGINKTTLRDRVRVYRQHILQPQYQKLKVEEHLRSCGKGQFKIFPFLQLQKQDTNLRRTIEENFINSFKTALNH